VTRQPNPRQARDLRRLALIAAALVLVAGAVAACGVINRSELTGRTWQLVSITEKVPAFQATVPADQQANYTILFNDDGTAAIQADCNAVTATFTTDDERITIVPGASTLAMCPEGSLGSEFVTVLSVATSYNVRGNAMTLYILNEGRLEFVVAAE
jgi:heat shock protein HslJ